jgi:hypothetical protein
MATEAGNALTLETAMPAAQLSFTRVVTLKGDRVQLEETVENLSALDRPIAWTQHVTLGAPFLEHGKTRFDLTATQSKTFEADFGDLYPRGVDFVWPYAPSRQGEIIDLREYPDLPSSAGYTAHLMDGTKEHSWFATYSPSSRVMFGYRWKRADFPWCGIWEENRSRQQTPWSGKTIARGFEFGVSPVPETRREMIDRGSMFGVPSYRWLPAKRRLAAHYEARIVESPSPDPASLFA